MEMLSISRFSVVVAFHGIIRNENRNKDFLHSSCSDCPSMEVGPVYFGAKSWLL